MNRFLPGNQLTLLRSGGEYFPALEAAIDEAESEIFVETYIFADDPTGWRIAEALTRAAARGVAVRVLVDGWGARHYLTRKIEARLRDGGVSLLKYRPEVAPWHFRSHRLRRLPPPLRAHPSPRSLPRPLRPERLAPTRRSVRSRRPCKRSSKS